MGYNKDSHSVEAIASFIFESNLGLLAMMGCVSTELHVALAQQSSALQEAVLVLLQGQCPDACPLGPMSSQLEVYISVQWLKIQ